MKFRLSASLAISLVMTPQSVVAMQDCSQEEVMSTTVTPYRKSANLDSKCKENRARWVVEHSERREWSDGRLVTVPQEKH